MVFHSEYLMVSRAASLSCLHICNEKKKEKKSCDKERKKSCDKESEQSKEGAYGKSNKPIGNCQRDKCMPGSHVSFTCEIAAQVPMGHNDSILKCLFTAKNLYIIQRKKSMTPALVTHPPLCDEIKS